MEKLHILATGFAKSTTPQFKDLSAGPLSIAPALETLIFLKSFRALSSVVCFN